MIPSQLDQPGTVIVRVDVPEFAEPGTSAVVRIQDGPGGTGNGPGVKVHICVAQAPPVVGPPVSQPPGQPQPGEPTTDIGTPFGVPGPSPAPEPEVPVKLPTRLPEAGSGGENYSQPLGTLHIAFALIAMGAALFGTGYVIRTRPNL
ncbi:hypothetical protein IID23_03935 [Patescibacteria group bacterium]|nr:hypothetical protein [Patescibacteria group bacterium]